MSEAISLNRESSLREARQALEEMFTHGTQGQRIKAAHEKLKKCSWTYNRVDEMFRGKARHIDAHELDQIRSLKNNREMDAARNEAAQLQRQLADARKAYAELTQNILNMGLAVDRLDAAVPRQVDSRHSLSRSAKIAGSSEVDRPGTDEEAEDDPKFVAFLDFLERKPE